MDTTVYIDMMQEGQGTQLRLSHIGFPTKRSARYAVEDFWKLSLENLRHWIEQKSIGNRGDYTVSPRGSVQVDIDIDASTTRVFEVLTNPEELKRYIATDPTVELEIGGRFDYGWGNDGPMKLLDLQPDKSLAYQWNNPETVVTWTLEGSDNKTHLTIAHSGFSMDKEIDGYHVGWSKYLNRIKFISEARSEFVRIVGDTTN